MNTAVSEERAKALKKVKWAFNRMVESTEMGSVLNMGSYGSGLGGYGSGRGIRHGIWKREIAALKTCIRKVPKK